MIVKQLNHPKWWRHLVVVLFLWALSAMGQAQTRVIDRAVASIGGKVIAWSELQFEARVLLVAAGGREAAFAPLDQAALDAGLSAIVDQRLTLMEADKLEAYQLESGELERAIVEFRKQFRDEGQFAAFLSAHEADLADLSEVLKRSLRSQRALEGKLRLRAQVSETEARAHIAAHPELKDVPLSSVRASLVQRRFVELAKKELETQRRQIDVRLLGPFAPKTGTP